MRQKWLIDGDSLYRMLCKHPKYGLHIMHEPNGLETIFFGDTGNDFANMINSAPTVDAVEVVRCKDCAFWTYEGVGSSTLKRFGSCAKWYPFGNEQHSCHDDDFCSYGERKDNA